MATSKQTKRRFSDPVIIAAITAIVTLVSLGGTLYVNYKIEKLHKQINSRMDQLLILTRASGVQEGKDIEEKKQ